MIRILFIFLFSLLSTIAIAQAELGLKAGIGASDMVMVGEPENYNDVLFNQKFAYQFGGYGILTLRDKVLARTEILFNNKGAQRQNFLYLSLPLLLQYKLLNNLNIEAGLEFGYLLLAKNPVLNYQAFDLGINFGANLALSPKVGLGIRYNIGLIDMLEVDLQIANNQGVLIDAVQFQNRNLQLSMSYRLFE